MGSEIVRDLATSKDVSEVIAGDASPANLEPLHRKKKVRTEKIDIFNKAVLTSLMSEADVVCGALPGRIGFELLVSAVSLGKNIVDISYTPRDPFELHRKAMSKDCAIVPQCGVAPGFTNMCVGEASRRLDKIVKIRIFVGGLPQKPVPPLNYRVVFSLDDVINEYTRPVRIIERGAKKIVEPLTSRGLLTFHGVGRLEYFLTDGLGTLPRSFPRVQHMAELTLRYPGHAEIMDTLRRAGFFNSKKVRVDGTAIEPRRLSLELLRSAFSAGSQEDFLALRVEVEGVVSRRRVKIVYQVLDKFDGKSGVSAMARTTAYPCTSVALLLGNRMVPWRGVVPPEKIGSDPRLFGFVLSRLRARRVKLRTQVRMLGS